MQNAEMEQLVLSALASHKEGLRHVFQSPQDFSGPKLRTACFDKLGFEFFKKQNDCEA